MSHAKNLEELVAKYPHILKEISHLECNAGWFPLIDTLCATITHQLNDTPVELHDEIYAVQIKEKFGGLRFYMNEKTHYISGAIRLAESFSYSICEVCGERGSLRQGGWMKTLCEPHAEEAQALRQSIIEKAQENMTARKPIP